eukprot:1136136-Pelagomonas_calceolata.AAC.8
MHWELQGAQEAVGSRGTWNAQEAITYAGSCGKLRDEGGTGGCKMHRQEAVGSFETQEAQEAQKAREAVGSTGGCD